MVYMIVLVRRFSDSSCNGVKGGMINWDARVMMNQGMTSIANWHNWLSIVGVRSCKYSLARAGIVLSTEHRTWSCVHTNQPQLFSHVFRDICKGIAHQSIFRLCFFQRLCRQWIEIFPDRSSRWRVEPSVMRMNRLVQRTTARTSRWQLARVYVVLILGFDRNQRLLMKQRLCFHLESSTRDT